MGGKKSQRRVTHFYSGIVTKKKVLTGGLFV